MKKVLFDIGHPAHVHLFKNFIIYLQKRGIEYEVVTRDKEITNALLTNYNIPFKSISKQSLSLSSMLWEFIFRGLKIIRLYIKNRYSIAMGTSVSIGYLSFFSLGKVISWNFCEDDDDIVPLQALLSYPFSTKIIVPDCLRHKYWKRKRVTYSSYHELAYLHPNNFIPDENILNKYGLEPKTYVIFRLSALKAHHDIGIKGISFELREKLKSFLSEYSIIESLEGKQGNKIEPYDMHHVLAFAKIIVCDSQTMAAEGMVLGVPSFRINSFVGKISYLEELENKYKLGFGILPEKEELILSTLKETISTENLESLWAQKKELMLIDKLDLNQWMINYFEENHNKKSQ